MKDLITLLRKKKEQPKKKKNGKTTVFLLIGFVFLARRLASLIERVIRFWNPFLVCVVSGVCETGYRNWEILIMIWKKTSLHRWVFR